MLKKIKHEKKLLGYLKQRCIRFKLTVSERCNSIHLIWRL